MLTFYVIRNKKNKNLFLKRATKTTKKKWVEGVEHATITASKRSAVTSLRFLKDDIGEIVEFELKPKAISLVKEFFIALKKGTKELVSTKKYRRRGQKHTLSMDEAEIFKVPRSFYCFIRVENNYLEKSKDEFRFIHEDYTLLPVRVIFPNLYGDILFNE